MSGTGADVSRAREGRGRVATRSSCLVDLRSRAGRRTLLRRNAPEAAPNASRHRGIEASSCAVLLGTLCAAWIMFFIPGRSLRVA